MLGIRCGRLGDFLPRRVDRRWLSAECDRRRRVDGDDGEVLRLENMLRTDYKPLHLEMKQFGIDAARFREFRAS